MLPDGLLPVCWALAVVVAMALGAAVADDQVLYDFGQGFDLAKLSPRDARLSLVERDGQPALRLDTGHTQDWPGVELPAPLPPWNLAKYDRVAMDVRNTGDNSVEVYLRVDNPGANGVSNCLTGKLDLPPGQAATLEVPLKRKPAGQAGIKLFGMRGYPMNLESNGTIDPASIVNLVVFVANPTADHAFEISNLRATGEYVAPPEAGLDAAHFFPFIDEFGQYIHRDWPGKTHAEADFALRRGEEAKDLQARPGPADWDQYGGWQGGPTLEATGFFRVQKYEGKWWLVDPEGHLFWSHGTDCVTPWEGATPLDDRDTWFRNLPAAEGQFAPCYGQAGHVVNGYYQGRSPKTFDFALANLVRKYGSPGPFADVSHRRLRSWGMNTIANWSDAAIYGLRRTPYVVTVGFGGKMLEGSQGYWGKFRDVFDPSFAAGVRAGMAGQVGKSAGDPWCLGYFVDNEIAWGDEVSLAVAALLSPPEQAAKQAFIADLQAKYGTIEKLNAAWGTAHASWDALHQHRGEPDGQKARADLTAFYSKTAETYFRTIREAVKAVAPNQLYLGCRFAWVNNLAADAAAKYCDVVSYNLYRQSVADFRFPGEADVPLIIGEFHFGALDRGMFHTGLVPTVSQEARAQAYRDYVQGALRNPAFVGTHWFKYMDEATTGRPLDEENYQIGLVDCCDTPYPETIAAVREVGYGMYQYRLNAK
jgi:hypothetical protein